jgi:hypothetical protein
MSPNYRPLTRRESAYKKRADEAEGRLAAFELDSTAASVIDELARRITELETQAVKDRKAINALRAKNGNLSDKNRQLTEHAKTQRTQIASLKWDVRLAHSQWEEERRTHEKCEQKRYEWATFARSVVEKLTSLRAENRGLKAQLNRSSDNSSLPPSSCPNKKKRVCNSREKTDRLPGGQPGHKGHSARKQIPDKVVALPVPDICPCCAGELKPTGEEKRKQLVDIEVTLHTTEFVGMSHVCAACGKIVAPEFPEGIINEVNYGNDVRTVATYLTNTCNVSLMKTAGFLHELTAHRLRLSDGTIHNFLKTFSKEAEGALALITSTIKAAPLVGSDATYTTADGMRSYVYVFHSEDSAIYQTSAHKGNGPLEASLLKDYQGTICHDHDLSYYNYGSTHAECNSHTLRYLKGVTENEPEKRWAPAMRMLLTKANELTKQALKKGEEKLPDEVIAYIEDAYGTILEHAEAEYRADEPIDSRYKPEGIALYRRLKNYKRDHLAFIHDLFIPFTNNTSEQLLRSTKRKTKQTGGFRSLVNGEVPYCNYQSITQTATMRGMEVIGVVRDIFSGKPDIFKVPSSTGPPADS